MRSSYRLGLLAVALSATACSHSPTSTVTVPAAAEPETIAATTSLPAPASVDDATELALEPTGDPLPVAVDGSPLPSAVTSAYLDHGGELLRTVDVFDGLAVRSMPFPDGVGVYVTDVEMAVESAGPGVVERSEAFGWLLEDVRTLGELLDAMASTLAITDGGWSHVDFPHVEMGADCVEREYSNPTVTVTWTLSGCSYNQFPTMHAVQIRRHGRYTTSGIVLPPEVADATNTGLVTRLGLTVTGWTYTVTAPDAAGATMAASVHYHAPADVEAQLRASLTGWTETPASEQHGLSWSSGSSTWELDGAGGAWLRTSGRVDQ